MHSTDNLDDGYLGSGHALWKSIRKYGKENFKREIIKFCKNRQELVEKEKEIVNLNEIIKKECMNLVLGGGKVKNYCPTEEIQHRRSSAGGKATSLRFKNDEEFKQKHSKVLSDRTKEGFVNGVYKNFKYDWTGKKHSEATKQKISKTRKERGCGIGEKNSMFGKKHSEETKKKISESMKKLNKNS